MAKVKIEVPDGFVVERTTKPMFDPWQGKTLSVVVSLVKDPSPKVGEIWRVHDLLCLIANFSSGYAAVRLDGGGTVTGFHPALTEVWTKHFADATRVATSIYDLDLEELTK